MASADVTFNILSKYNDRGVKRAERDFAGLSRSVGRLKGLLVGGLVAAGGATLLTGFVKDAAESAKIARITESAIKATGGAAKVTASQVGQLSTALSNKTAVDDELVQTGANLLLTFKNIRNETGKGNDIFNQATAAALDLSAAGFGSVENASKMLGKALNDPLKGITALGRAGVTFSEEQKKQIKTMVEAGDVLGAQKIIMQEVASQVGGAAAAAADPMERLKVIAGNLGEQIGGYLLPWVEKASEWLGENLPKALEKAEFYIGVVRDAFNDPDVTSDGFVGFLERVGVAAREVFDFFKAEILPRLKDFGTFLRDDVGPALLDFGGWLEVNVLPHVKDLGKFLKDDVVPAVEDFGSWLKDNTGVVKGVTAALTALVVVTKAHAAAMAVQAAGGILAFLGAYIANLKIVQAATKAWAAVQWILNIALNANPIGLIVIAIAAFVAAVIIAYKKSETFRAIVDAVWAGIKTAIKAVVDWFVNTAWPWLKRTFDKIMEGFGEVRDFFSRTWRTIKDVIAAGVRFVVDKFLGMAEGILDAAATAFGWIPGIGDKLKTARDQFATFRNNVNNALGGIKDKTVSVRASVSDITSTLVAAGFSRDRATRAARNLPLASGGMIPRSWGGPREDNVWLGKVAGRDIMASGGEYVVNARSAAKHLPLLREINADKFAAGGRVGVATDYPNRTVLVRLASGIDRFYGAIAKLTSGAASAGLKAIMAGASMRTPGATAGWTRPLRPGSYRVGMRYLGYPGHYGADYPASIGTGVYAAKPGTVARALSLAGSYGKHIFLNHAGRWSTRYAHLSQMLVGAGQTVKAGQLIGRVGSTGNSTGPHLHFEVRYNGGPRNPRGLVFDQGGWLPPGLSMAYNGTGQPERVLPPSRSRGGDTHIHIHAPNYVGDKRDLVAALEQLRRSGRLPVAS